MPDGEAPTPVVLQPFRSSFLLYLGKRDPRAIEEVGRLFEEATRELWERRSVNQPLALSMSRATLEDLEALIDHNRDALSEFDETVGAALHNAMKNVAKLLDEAAATLSPLLKAEDRTESADRVPCASSVIGGPYQGG